MRNASLELHLELVGIGRSSAGKVERRLVMIGVRLPEEGAPVGTIFPLESFGNLLPELAAV
jgi:hypothetical protein